MCYQLFVHYACGHDKLFATPCIEAEGIPFFLKHACMNYRSDSEYPLSLCGKGGYYCGKLPGDGEFLDGVHDALARHQGQLVQIDQKRAVLSQKALQFNQIAARMNVSREVRRQHPAYGMIAGDWSKLRDARERVARDVKHGQHIIKEAKKWFERREAAMVQASQPTWSLQPALTLPPDTGSIPIESTSLPAPHLSVAVSAACPPTATTQQFLDINQGIHMPAQTPTCQPLSDGSTIDVTHMRRATGYLDAGLQANTPVTPPQKGLQAAVLQLQSGAKTTQPAPQIELDWDSGIGKTRGRRGAGRRAKPAVPKVSKKDSHSASKKNSNTARRSERVRDKKASYAESQASDASRPSSPDKYDSEQSPERSDVSESPEPEFRRVKQQQSKPQRKSRTGASTVYKNNDTFANKIGDWRRLRASSDNPLFGKFQIVQNEGEAGRQAAAQQTASTVSGSEQSSGNVWRASPSQHSQIMLQDAASLTTGRQGMFGLGGGNNNDAATVANPLGRPFPDNSKIPVATAPTNIFNMYLQQDVPGLPAAGARAQQWSVQQGNQYSSPQYALHSISDDGLCNPDTDGFSIAGMQGYSNNAPTITSGSGLQTPSASRADSVIFSGGGGGGGGGVKLSDIDMTTYFDYDRMRQSFGVQHDLSPAKAPGSGSGLLASEPKKKRAPPASSPTPAAKRPRLSLPGCASEHDANEAAAGHRLGENVDSELMTTYSSPAKMTASKTSMVEDDGKNTYFDTSTPTPAPIMAPTAIHFPKANSPTIAENLESTAGLPSTVIGDGTATGYLPEGLKGSGLDATLGEEIDWKGMEDLFAFDDL